MSIVCNSLLHTNNILSQSGALEAAGIRVFGQPHYLDYCKGVVYMQDTHKIDIFWSN